MNQERRLLTTVKVVALALVIVSASVEAYAALSSTSLSRFSLYPYSTASYNTTSYSPQANYSLYVTADNCAIEVLPSADNTLHATLQASNSFFLKSFANIEVTERAGVFTFDMITPQWIGTDASAFVYIPGNLPAHIISVVTQNGALTVDAPNHINSITLETTNGKVNLQGDILNNVTMQTTNGNLYVSSTSFYNVIANTVNGNVETHFGDRISSGSLSMTTTNGNLEFYVNAASNLTITASTVNGEVSITGLTYTANQFTSRQFVGTVNSGGATINLTTVNGDIRLVGS